MASFAEWQQKKYDCIRMIAAYSERNVILIFFLPCYASIRCILESLIWFEAQFYYMKQNDAAF